LRLASKPSSAVLAGPAPAGEEAQAVDHTAALHARKEEAAKAWTLVSTLAGRIQALEDH